MSIKQAQGDLKDLLCGLVLAKLKLPVNEVFLLGGQVNAHDSAQ